MDFDTINCGSVDPVEQDLKRHQAESERLQSDYGKCIINRIESIIGSDIRSYGFEGLTDEQAHDIATHFYMAHRDHATTTDIEHRINMIGAVLFQAIKGHIEEECL